MNLRIKDLLFPVSGLDLSPPAPPELDIRGNFADLQFSWLLGNTPVGSAIIEATSTGSLKVADTGAGLETYTVDTGQTVDAYAAGQTHEYSSGWNFGRLLIEQQQATIALKNSAGTWGDDVDLLIGAHEVSMTFYGIKFKSRDAGYSADYQFWGMS